MACSKESNNEQACGGMSVLIKLAMTAKPTHLLLDALVDHVRYVGEPKDEVLKAVLVSVGCCLWGLGTVLRRHL